MKSMRRRAFTLSLLIAAMQLPLTTYGLSKPPKAPRFIGEQVTYRGRIFTALSQKIGNKRKLVWDSGRVLPTPSPVSTSPLPTTTATSTPSPKVFPLIDIAVGDSSVVPNNSTLHIQAKNRFGNSVGYLIHRSKEGLRAFSDICAHKGCSVQISNDGYLCPCHNALFESGSGKVLRGPASYPLEEIPVREEEGKIIIRD